VRYIEKTKKIKNKDMRITKIERPLPITTEEIFEVTEEPNWFEKLLGEKTRVSRYKDTYREYKYGYGNRVYVSEEGIVLGNTIGYKWEVREAIDTFRRMF
jgi:hypothetical protein